MRLITAGLVFFFVLIILGGIQVVSAVPPLPAEYYGDILIGGSPAPAGTSISAYIQDIMKGSLITVEPGKFGGSGLFDPRLKVNVSEDEYKAGNLSVRFLINGYQAAQIIPFEPGTARELAISIENLTFVTPEITPEQTVVPYKVQTVDSEYNSNPPAIINNPPQNQTPARQGLLNEMKYTSDDGIAELILKKDTVMLSPSGQFVQNIDIKSRNINDLAVISDRSLLFSGYAYEITPEKTFFNPEGMLRINIPLERKTDLFAMNPQLYQYDRRMLTWNHIDTGKNQFNGVISADVNEGAVYALFFAKNNQGNIQVSDGQTQVPYPVNNPQYYSPSGNQPQPPLPPSSQNSGQNINYGQSDVTSDNITNVNVLETISPATIQTQIIVNSTNTSDNPDVVIEATPTKKAPGTSNNQKDNTDSAISKKTFFGSGVILIILIILIILANVVVYLVYKRWWLNRS